MRGSVISWIADRMPSRPMPDSFTPPYGIGSSRQLGVSPTIRLPTSISRNAVRMRPRVAREQSGLYLQNRSASG